jgi:hypothetical protein
MRSGGGEIRVSSAPENTEMIVGGVDAEESEVRNGVSNRLGQTVEEVGGSVKGLGPVVSWKRGLKEHGAHDIVRCANHALSPTVLRRHVGARHAEVDTAREKKVMGHIVIELTPVVTLDTLDGVTELSGDPSEEVRQGWERCPTYDVREKSTCSARSHRERVNNTYSQKC